MNTVKVERNNSLLWAQTDRPDSLNAINFAVMDDLEKLLTIAETDTNIRALILSGSSKAFISGGDLREFHTLKTAEEAKNMAARMMDILERIERLPCWTIACINAPAYGGGCEIMLAFDFRIASTVATFGFTQGKFYLPPGWGGLTRLIERVGRSTALKWLAEAATVDADTALHHKLIDDLQLPGKLTQNTRSFAERITKNDRDFIQNLKLGAMRSAENQRDAIHAELEMFGQFWESDLHKQRVEEFLNRNENSR